MLFVPSEKTTREQERCYLTHQTSAAQAKKKATLRSAKWRPPCTTNPRIRLKTHTTSPKQGANAEHISSMLRPVRRTTAERTRSKALGVNHGTRAPEVSKKPCPRGGGVHTSVVAHTPPPVYSASQTRMKSHGCVTQGAR